MNALIPTNTNDMLAVAKQLALSNFFADARKTEEAFVKILAGAEMGIPPFAAMTGIHIIKGKPSVGAGIMSAKVKGSGKYDYEVREQSDKICSIDFYQGEKLLGNSTFTIEKAKKAGVQNLDKWPENMLFARAMSNGVRFYTPDVFNMPVYTPEEMGEREVQETTATVVQEAAPAEPRKTKRELAVVMQEQEEISERKAKWLDSIEGITDIQGIEEAKEEMKNSNMDGIGKDVGEALIFRAWQLGWEFDKETKAFVRIPAAETEVVV